MRNDDTVWEVRGKHFSRTRCQNISVKGDMNICVLKHSYTCFTEIQSVCFYLSKKPFFTAHTFVHSHLQWFFLHSPFSLSFRDLTVIPVEKPPTHGARGSQLSKTPELLAALNRSPTQHHYLLQLHKCWFPTTSTLAELHTPMRARTTAEPRVQSKTPARNSINCTRACTTLHH